MNQTQFDQFFSSSYTLSGESIDPESGTIENGFLTPKPGSGSQIPIIQSIPRFVEGKNYAENFGLQWNEYQSTQLDSRNGSLQTFQRFYKFTKWKPRELFGKTILEVGSGAGRFTEILLEAGAKVVSFDYSNAVDANLKNNENKGDLLLFQGDLYNMPMEDEQFDFVFCYGVLQHTPDPVAAFQSIYKKLKPGGKISIDYYLKTRKLTPWSTPKYAWRNRTSKMEPKKLLKLIRFYIPLWLWADTLIRSIPKIGPKLIAFLRIPCWNYLGIGLSRKQRLEWAIMDTFDALGAAYDEPKTLEEVSEMVNTTNAIESDVFYGSNGVVANAIKPK
ncbi:class I SAM-dependent methyltransferase [bacterium]|nr:class I SAM-dependent methyltransferase [bacterium]